MQKNWLNFYSKRQAPSEPSTFARFIIARNITGKKAVDLGSGNGRDSYALGRIYDRVTAIDPNFPEKKLGWVLQLQKSWDQAKEIIAEADVVYSRFFLHSVSNAEIEEIVKLTKGYFCAEARAIGDKPVVYPEHDRNYIDGEWLRNLLVENGFEVEHYEVARGLAPYKSEDPLLVRIIAKRI